MELLTKREVAKMLRVCTRTLDRMCDRGLLPIVPISGKIMFDKADVDDFLSGQKQHK